MASTRVKVLFLLIILIICNAQEQLIHVKPDSCPQECSCSYQFPDCQTLSEYALNTSSYLPSKFILIPGQYYLDSDFLLNGTSTESFSLNGTENTTIYCRQKATLSFNGLTSVTIQNVAFVSCGEGDLPGISLTNINTVKMMDISVANTTSGALYIKDSLNVELTNLVITNNKNSLATIVSIQNSGNTTLNDLSIFNNSIGEYDSECVYSSFPNAEEVVFRIDGGFLTAESIYVTDNVGPFGVMALSNVEAVVNGDWSFKRNLVCLGGSLFLSEVNIEFSGNLFSIENKEINEKYKSTAGLYFNISQVNINGTLESIANEGYITSIKSVGSSIFLKEESALLLNGNVNGFDVMSLAERSKLIIINGTLTACNNTIRQRLILVDTSQLMVNGRITFINTPLAPLTGYNAIIHLYGQIHFQDNAGIVYAVKSDLDINGNSTFYRNNVDDGYKDGALTIVQSTLKLGGNYTFLENLYDNEDGGAIYATITSTVTFSGNGTFLNNSAKNGGAIFIDQKSRLELDKETKLLFNGNSAENGGAIFIGTSVDHVQCINDPNTCLFHPINSGNLNTSLTFENNTAYPGGSVIHVNFDIINDSEITYPALKDLGETFKIASGNSVPTLASDSYWFCFCENDSRKGCARNDPPMNISAIKGKPFSVMMRALKFYGNINMSEPVRRNLLSALLSINTDDNTISSLTTDGRLQSASPEKCMEVSFTVKSEADMEVLVLNVGESFLDGNKALYVNVHFNKLCPDGFPSDEQNYSCVCDEKIRNFLQSCEITDEIFQKRIEFQSYWMAPANQSKYQGAMSWYENCPNRYCITDGNFTFSNDDICDNNRSGVLCGSCKGNTSLLLGGDVCGDCSDNAHLALLVVFAVAGILVVALIFLSQMTVASGTINGLIFYVNILNSNQTVFFPEGFFPGYTIFISWLNLNFGIETCFYDGMNQIAYSGLQFVFPVYIWILAGLIVVLCRYSVRVSKFFSASDPVAVLATIILLSFTSLAQNIIIIFYYSAIKNPGNMRTAVWRYDGNVEYASEHHLTLIIIASVFLLLLLTPYTLVLFSAQVLQKSDYISKILQRLRIQPFIHTYLIPFKPNHRYWAGLSLLMRVILLIIFAFGSGENQLINLLAIITTCIVAITIFKVTGGIYDKSWIDTLEMSFLVNLGVLAAATSYSLNSSIHRQREIATYISISIALLTFIGIIILHVYWRLKKLPMMKEKMEAFAKKMRGIKLHKRQKLIINEPSELEANKVTKSVAELTSATYQVDLREPLLESQIH
ncbi:uncharacterized protein LOC135344016 isoform X2 [Halichondria panicea]|uniref:uncharacterized protein LOC135344016 isoform X2 n=1 Tax=Halichondria panicea TaxID=6063 RepID=UPI00312BBC5C